MPKCRSWLLAANITLGLVSVIACRSQPVVVEQTIEVTRLATKQVVVEVEASPVTVEVTRLVVETKVIEITPAPLPTESKSLVICLADEPDTMYPYARQRLGIASTHVLGAIYENLYTTLSYQYQARGIEKIPSLADGDATIRRVEARSGDTVLDVNNEVVTLEEGVRVKNFDGEQVTFGQEPIDMLQMTVRFQLKPLVWSDGTPVTADDSVFSFELAADPATPVSKQAVERTASYVATGNLSLEWTGIPGYASADYFTEIWMPYPRHYWGDLPPGDLLQSDKATTTPLSHGPFVISEWIKGDYIRLNRNDHYYLADQGLPKVDTVTFKFVPRGNQLLAQLLSGQCDIATHEGIGMDEWPFLIDAEEGGLLQPYFQTGTVFEHIDFGINPVEEQTALRPDWFEDVRVRQALVMCTDRQGMVDEFLLGRSQVVHAYVPDTHPLFPDDAIKWPYDVEAAVELLESAGYSDLDEDGFLEDPFTGARFKAVLLSALGNRLGEQVANAFKEGLADCGVEVELQFLNSDQYFADGPVGPLFGRKFDLAAFPWLISIEPNCALYLSSRIPGPGNGWNRNYNNETGFENPEFDAACNNAQTSLPGTAEYEASHKQALGIFMEQVPIIPLFLRLKAAATRPEVRNFIFDSTQNSELWNLYEIDIER